MHWQIIFFMLLVWGMPVLASPTPLEKQIQDWFSMIEDQQAQKRFWAMEQLSKLGEQILPQAKEKYPSLNYQGRRMMVRLLSRQKTPQSTDFFLQFLQDEDLGVRNLAIIELLDRCDQDEKLFEKIKTLETSSPDIKTSLEVFLDTYYHKKVEEGLSDLISSQGGFGTYEGQFNKMLPLQGNAITPLMHIFQKQDKQEYKFVRKDLQVDNEAAYKIRYLAGSAFVSFQSCMTEEQKQQVIAVLLGMANSNLQEDEQLREIARTTLYFMGKREYIEDEIDRLKQKIIYNQEDAESYAELGLLYLRIGQDRLALQFLRQSVEIAPNYGHAYYNLACAYACLGKTEDAMQALETAVAVGYDDVDWMLKDGDLRSLHKNPRFIALVNNLQNRINPGN